jgi:hypothetical protein
MLDIEALLIQYKVVYKSGEDCELIADLVQEELSLIAAETGMDREGCYCPERHFEDTLRDAGVYDD